MSHTNSNFDPLAEAQRRADIGYQIYEQFMERDLAGLSVQELAQGHKDFAEYMELRPVFENSNGSLVDAKTHKFINREQADALYEQDLSEEDGYDQVGLISLAMMSASAEARDDLTTMLNVDDAIQNRILDMNVSDELIDGEGNFRASEREMVLNRVLAARSKYLGVLNRSKTLPKPKPSANTKADPFKNPPTGLAVAYWSLPDQSSRLSDDQVLERGLKQDPTAKVEKKSRWGKILAFGAAALAVLGITYGVSQCEGDDSGNKDFRRSEQPNNTTTTTLPENPAETTVVVTVPPTKSTSPEATTPSSTTNQVIPGTVFEQNPSTTVASETTAVPQTTSPEATTPSSTAPTETTVPQPTTPETPTTAGNPVVPGQVLTPNPFHNPNGTGDTLDQNGQPTSKTGEVSEDEDLPATK